MAGENKGLCRRDPCAPTHRASSFSEDFLQRTIRVWQPYSPKLLTEEDAREIAANVTALVVFLNQLDQKYREVESEYDNPFEKM